MICQLVLIELQNYWIIVNGANAFMKPFKIVAAKSIEDINKCFDTTPRSSYILAGGIDLMDEIKEGLKTPNFLVDLMNL